MDILEAVKKRRAIKKFDKSVKMTGEEKDTFLELARLAPTAYNLQHTRLVVVEDQELREKMCLVAHGQPQITDCSLLLVLCADLKAWENSKVKECWQSAPQEVCDFLFPRIQADYEHDREYERDEVMRSMGIAAGQMMITAQAMGYDTCPMVGFDFARMAELIRLPADHVIGLVVAVGKRAEEPRPRPDLIPRDRMIVKDHF